MLSGRNNGQQARRMAEAGALSEEPAWAFESILEGSFHARRSPKTVSSLFPAIMMRSAVKCAASVRLPALAIKSQPQVSTQAVLQHPFPLRDP